jgi:hypothetical protein
MLIPHLVLERIQSEEKSDSKCRTCTQSRAGRQIGYVMNLHSLIDSHEFEAGAYRWVCDVSVPDNVFHLRIRDSAVVLKKRWQVAAGDITAFVDRGR